VLSPKELLKYTRRVIAIEKDPELITLLTQHFSEDVSSEKLTLIEGDALKLLPTISQEEKTYKVVANIPYYITGQIIRELLSLPHQPQSITLIIQKEVAERIVCRDGKESVLSLSVNVFGVPHYVRKIAARYFTPKPDVDSAVIHIDTISREHLPTRDVESHFFTLIKTGFAHKRKQLLKNLETLSPKDQLIEHFNTCDITHNTRAEDVPLEKWLCLHKTLGD
jgi:16S rRNA (adenine1518-N6/adenine1519-N6)-dimethyltransferase